MEVIEEGIEAYPEGDEYWLKLHHFAADIDIELFDQFQKAQAEIEKEFENPSFSDKN